MIEEIVKSTTEKMEQALEGIHHELSAIRTGKASTGLVEHVQIEAYGTKMPLNQLATINAPEPRLLLIQPWDKSQIGPITKAIQTSDLGLTPTNDSQVIRVPIPTLNEERRKELVRLAHKIAEQGRVSVRHWRREANEQLKSIQKDGKISEDNERDGLEQIQILTDKYIEKLDSVLKTKEEEIMEV